MASSTYDRRWQEAMAELNEQVHIEDHTLSADSQDSIPNEAPPQASIVEAFQHYACLYIKYIQILKRLADCYDQMVHPQKRIDVKQVMEVVTTRVVELKHDLVKWNPPNPDVATVPERSFPWEYVNLDDILVDLKLPPETLEIPVPKSFVEDHAEELLRRERLVKGYMKLKHGVDTIFLDSLEEQVSLTGALSMDEAIAILQRNERGRQGKQRGVLVKELREEEKQRKLYESAQAPEMNPDIAAANIQRMFRGYYSRAMASKERDEELIFIGMKSPHTDRSLLEKKLADARLQRKTEQAENKEEYERALVDLHGVVGVEEGPFMKEKMLEERRRWITDVMATGQLPENLDAYYAALNGDDETAKAQAKEAEEAAAAAAAKKKDGKGGKKDAKKDDKKGGKGDKKGAKGKGEVEEEEAPEKPPPLTGPSELCTKLATAVGQYEKVWLEKEELDNFYQKYDVALAKDVVRGPVEVQVRQQVDEMLVLQLVNIKAQLEAAAASGKKGKKGKKGGGKKEKKGGKKGGKKGDKKKGKALPGDKIAELKGRAPDSFLSILVEQKVVHMPRKLGLRIQDFVGSFNYLGTVHQNSDRRDRFGNWVPQDPSAAQLRQNLTEYAILPLGSLVVRSKTPHVRSIMLYGPKGSGKTMLVSAIANETGALVLNLSPANLVGKFTGKTGPTKLVHMAFLLAKVASLQPVLIYIDECEQVFAGGGGKKSKASSDGPSRFKKDLLTYLKSAMDPLDRVLIVGTTSDPGAGEVKDYRAFFDKFLHVPYPDYASRVLLWKHALDETVKKHTSEGNSSLKTSGGGMRLHRDELDISTLAHISEGYSSGSIVKAVEQTLTPRRVECLEKRPLKEEEFIGALSRQTATFADDHEKFKAFTAVITGLKDTREKLRKAAEDALNPDDKKGEKGKGKGGAKKGKK
ncbi:Dynein regulatory complex protein 11 [Globisporangium polare]